MAWIVPVLVRGLVAGLVFSVGVDVRPREATALLRRPDLLVRTFAAMYVATPLAAVGLARLLPLPPGVEVCLLVLSVSSGAPLLTRRLARLGNRAAVASLVFTSALLAVVTVPLSAALLGPLYGRDVDVPLLPILQVVATTVLIPLVAGMAFRHLAPRAAARWARLLPRVARPLLLVGLLGVLVVLGPRLVAIGLGTWGALLAFAVVAVSVGHVLGPARPADRTALAVFCATRHLGIALLLAATLLGGGAGLLVIAYALCALLVTALYLRWRARTLDGS